MTQESEKQNSKGESLFQQPPFHQICHCGKCSRGTQIDCGSYLNAAPARTRQLLLQIDAMEKRFDNLQDKKDGKVHVFRSLNKRCALKKIRWKANPPN